MEASRCGFGNHVLVRGGGWGMRDAADGGGVGEEDAAGVSPFSGLKVGIQGVMEHDDDDDLSFFWEE
ncbi:hypothetical protein ACFX2J_015297 [Malus domestica]